MIDKYTIAQITTGDPFKIPAWQKLLKANDPENFTAASPVPLLIIQGGADEQIPVASTQLLAQHLCGVGQDLERWIYPGQSHAGVIGPSFGDMVHWIKDRFAGGADPDSLRADRPARCHHHHLSVALTVAGRVRLTPVAPSSQRRRGCVHRPRRPRPGSRRRGRRRG